MMIFPAKSVPFGFNVNHLQATKVIVAIGILVGCLPGVLFAQMWGTGSGGAIYYNGGNVGIGTTSPNTPLHIKVPGYAAVQIQRTVDTNSADVFIIASAGTDGFLSQRPSSSRFSIVENANGSFPERFTVLSGGNLGVGTSSPTASLHVTSSGHANLEVQRGADTNASDIFLTGLAGKDGWFLSQRPSSSRFGIVENTTGVPERVTVMPGGNVGIGTTAPQNLLSVNGTVRAKEVLVNTGWSDYVFDPSYRLRPLSEVNTYVNEHHHLPGIPSADEVAKDGINVGDMQAKLLAKIEELTLHMIQLEQQNRDIKQQVQELRGKIPSEEQP